MNQKYREALEQVVEASDRARTERIRARLPRLLEQRPLGTGLVRHVNHTGSANGIRHSTFSRTSSRSRINAEPLQRFEENGNDPMTGRLQAAR